MASTSQLTRRARLEARTKHAPERRGLRSQVRDRKRQRNAEVRSARNNADAMSEYALSTQNDINRIFDDSTQRFDTAGSLVEGLGGGGGPEASALLAALAGERTRQRSSLASNRGAELSRAVDSSRRAKEGGIFAERQARSSYSADAATLFEKIRDSLRAEGDDASVILQNLFDAEEDRAFEREKFEETKSHNRAMEGKARRDARKGSFLTPGQNNTELDRIRSARDWIQRMSSGGLGSKQIRGLLATGGKVPVGDQEITIPKFEIDHINSAYDLHAFGRLSPTNAKALRRRKVKTPKDWLPEGNKQPKPKLGSGVQGRAPRRK